MNGDKECTKRQLILTWMSPLLESASFYEWHLIYFNKDKDLRVLILVASLLLQVHVTKAESIYACDINCNNPFSVALNNAPLHVAGDRFSVIDTKNNTVVTYLVEEFQWYGEPFQRAVETSTTSYAYATLQEFTELKKTSSTITLTIPEDLPNTSQDDNTDTVYKLFTHPATRNNVADYISNNTGVYESMGALVAGMLEIFGKIINIDVVVKVQFADGSTAEFKVTGIDPGSVQWAYDLGTARSSEGFSIPEKSEQFLGHYNFIEESNQQHFSTLASLFDLRLTDGKQCTPTKTTVCRKNGDEIECEVFRQCE